MYTQIWNAVRPHLCTEHMQADIAEFFEYSRWSSFDKINGLARLIANRMEAEGMEDVRLIEFPADGKTSYSGWVMPRAYDVHEARLSLLSADDSATVLADYHLNPTSLMLYSLPTPPNGITAEVVTADTLEEMTTERLTGRLVLTSDIGIEYSQAAMRSGAYGLVSDCRNSHRTFKNGPEVDLTNEWHNYTIPPWDHPNKGFGFAISPEQGKRLRSMLAAGQPVRLHALVNTTHYEGILPVVSGRLPGLIPEEIVLTGHYDEFGADDNCSQIAVALEVVRSVRAMIRAGEIPPLLRSIRLLFPMEVRGFNGLIQNEAETRHMRAGLNIDTVGTDQNIATATCTLSDNLTPSYSEEFAAELLSRVAEENLLFRWRQTDAEMIDNIFGEPLIGAPTPAIWHFSATHHLATDTPDRVSGRMLVDMARVAATYSAFLAKAGLQEAIWLSELAAANAVRSFQDVAAASLRHGIDTALGTQLHRLSGIHERYSRKLVSPIGLVPSLSYVPCPEVVEAEQHTLMGEARLLPQELFHERVSAIRLELDREYEVASARVRRNANEFFNISISEEAEATPLSRCVPVKAIRGFAGFEDLSDEEQQYVRNVLKIQSGYGAPMWLQNALVLANGKRTAGEIAALLRLGGGQEVIRLERIFAFLATRGMVRLRPYLTQLEVKVALERTGLGRGDLVLGHFSLSRFGYIEDGADGLIETLLSILGPNGTLAMPTFTFSWIGRRPYDPFTTPSRVGAVTDCFRKWPGVLRSNHPTHSFAAVGKRASELLSNHDYTKSPLSDDGPLGKLADMDGKILLFAPREANTIMHIGEYRAGLPLLDFICPVAEDGMRREVVVPDCPWHVRFAPAYDKLYTRGLVREAVLGESTLYTMYARDAISVQVEVMRETPEALIQPGCDCLYCQRLAAYCREVSDRHGRPQAEPL